MRHLFSLCGLLACLTLQGQNQAPFIQNLLLQGAFPGGPFTLTFQLADAEQDACEITVQLSSDGGRSYSTLSTTNQVSGDVGFPVAPGNKTVACTNLNIGTAGTYVFRVIADDRQPFDLQALVDEVDSLRLRADLSFIEGIRHRTTGLPHLNATRDTLQALFKQFGLYAERQLFNYTNTTGQNIIGSLPGSTAADTVVIIDAHYDTVNNAPGADDNGSGTVGMLEVARLLSRYPAKKTMRYIGFDLEESGLIGSIRYVSSGVPPDDKIAGVFNFEMIGYWSEEPNSQTLPNGFGLLFPLQAQQVADNQFRGDFISNVGNTNSQQLSLLYSNAAQQYVPGLKVITLDVPGNGTLVPDLRRSDHAPFWDAGYRAIMLTDGANFRNECYHTPGDTLNEKLNFTFMSNVVKAALAAAAQLAEVQHGDWATAAFEVQTGTDSPVTPPCSIKCWGDGGLQLQAINCAIKPMMITLFDLNGRQVLHHETSLSVGEIFELPTNHLPAGVYVLQLQHAQGRYVQKVMINR